VCPVSMTVSAVMKMSATGVKLTSSCQVRLKMICIHGIHFISSCISLESNVFKIESKVIDKLNVPYRWEVCAGMSRWFLW